MLMKKLVKRSLFIVGGVILVLAGSLTGLHYTVRALGFGCTQHVDVSATSPDNKWIAQAVEESCGGIAGDGHYFVTLGERDQDSKTVFDFFPRENTPFELHWLTPTSLQIVYPGASENYKKLDSYKNVVISYSECPRKLPYDFLHYCAKMPVNGSS